MITQNTFGMGHIIFIANYVILVLDYIMIFLTINVFKSILLLYPNTLYDKMKLASSIIFEIASICREENLHLTMKLIKVPLSGSMIVVKP